MLRYCNWGPVSKSLRTVLGSALCWVCCGWESGVERHLSRVSLLPRVSSLVGVCICMLVPTLCLPNHPPFYPARGPSFLLCGDGRNSDGISQNLQQSDKSSSGRPGGDAQGPGHTGAGTWDRLHVPMCRVPGALLLLGHQMSWRSALLYTC